MHASPDPLSPESRRRLASLANELETQSDRGAVIIAAAWLDDMLLHLLKSTLKDHKASWTKLFGTGGPLESFSNRIDLATLLGIISTEVRSDLHIIREIRNEFAHQVAHRKRHDALTLDSDHIADKCRALACPASQGMPSSRQRFLTACASLSKDFELGHIFGGRIKPPGQVAYTTPDSVA